MHLRCELFFRKSRGVQDVTDCLLLGLCGVERDAEKLALRLLLDHLGEGCEENKDIISTHSLTFMYRYVLYREMYRRGLRGKGRRHI